MLTELKAIAAIMVEKAKEGDTAAASLVMSRVMPVLRPQSDKVCFSFDASAPVAQQVEQVLQAISEGAVAPDVGKQIIDAIGTLSDVRAAEELEQRIIMLEAKQL
jgi:hypothetical protein